MAYNAAGSAVGEPMRKAIMDTACVAVWTNSSDDAFFTSNVAAFSQQYHSGAYGSGAYIGEPVPNRLPLALLAAVSTMPTSASALLPAVRAVGAVHAADGRASAGIRTTR